MSRKEREAVQALLFERLADEDQYQGFDPEGLGSRDGGPPPRYYGRDELRASIVRELSRVLSTRAAVLPGEALSRNRTVLDYGLPDLDADAPGGASRSPRQISEIIRQTIEAYEPRLRNVDVTLVELPDRGDSVWVAVTGDLVAEGVHEPFSADIPLGGAGGRR